MSDATPAQTKLRTLEGRVVSNKMEKTITVLVERRVKHPLYKKYIRRSTKLHAHDEENTCQIGDVVSISPSRPMSKTKAWRLESILTRAV
ncbi:MAG: 30S ribosomal protein S17 [Gammaproteobacteria bacterium]|nr:30S ribosomal protein S17 [Gammaproteobacteria bacterium]